MRAVVQRVKDAWITVNGGEKQYMEQGLVVLFGVNDTDEAKDTAVLAKKIAELVKNNELNIEDITIIAKYVVICSKIAALEKVLNIKP